MSAPGDLDISREFRDAITYGTLAVVIGNRPDHPGEYAAEAYYITPDMERRALPARLIADSLRQIADSIEADGVPL